MAVVISGANALPQIDIFPQFVCPSDHPVGGCCKEFTTGGVGAGCKCIPIPPNLLALLISKGVRANDIVNTEVAPILACDDAPNHTGIPACCNISTAQIVSFLSRICSRNGLYGLILHIGTAGVVGLCSRSAAMNDRRNLRTWYRSWCEVAVLMDERRDSTSIR